MTSMKIFITGQQKKLILSVFMTPVVINAFVIVLTLFFLFPRVGVRP